MGSQPLKYIAQHRTPVLIAIDLIAFQVAFFLTYELRFESGMFTNPLQPKYANVAILLSVFWLLVYLFNGMYKRKISISRYEAFLDVFKSVLIGTVILFFISMEPNKPITSTRIILITYSALLLIISGGGHSLYRTLIKNLYRRNIGQFRSIIVGYNKRGQNLYSTLKNHPEYGHHVIGIVHMEDEENPDDSVNHTSINNIREFLANRENDDVDYVLIAMEPEKRNKVMEVIDEAHQLNYRVMIVPDFFQILVGLAKSRELYGVPLLEVFPDLLDPSAKIVKRAMDIIVSLIVLVIGFPLMFLVALIIKFDSKGPALYKQRRVGYRGKEFTLLKFRSMRQDAEKTTGAVWATEHDPRITKVGRFMRATRIDELPQAWNVLRGDMSLVGPRPERKVFVEEFAKQIPFYMRRLNVKPGLTGWAQVRRGYDASVDDVKEKLQYDLFYLENLSIGLDIKILLNTIWVVITAKGQ